MRFVYSPSDYDPSLPAKYRRHLALADNIANAVIAVLVLGAVVAAVLYFL